MGYAVQMCEKQASGSPKVVDQSITMKPLDEAILAAKAYLETAMVPGTDIWAGVGTGAVFIRIVELDSVGSPTKRVVFEYSLADRGNAPPN